MSEDGKVEQCWVVGSVFQRVSRRDFIKAALIQQRSVLVDRGMLHWCSSSFERGAVTCGEQCDFVVERFSPLFHKEEIPFPLVKQAGF